MDQMQSNKLVSGCGGRRTISLIVLGFVFTIIVGDQLLAYISFPRLIGSSNPIRWKLELYEQEERPIDVVYMGCSHEECGISPVVVDKRVSKMLGRSVISLNMAASCASSISSSLLARRVTELPDPPKLLYLGINWHSSDCGYENWQEFGLRALSKPRDWSLTWKCRPRLFAESILAGTFDSYYLWREYQLATRRLVQGAPLFNGKRWHYNPGPDRGWSRTPETQELLRVQPYYAESMKSILSYQAGMFDPGNPNEVALRTAIAELREHGITPKLLEMPITSIMDDIIRPDVMQRYEAFVNRLIEDTGVELVRPPDNVVSDEDFYDFVHMYPHGARRFSDWFAADVAGTLAKIEGKTLNQDGSAIALSGNDTSDTTAQ